MNYAKTPTYMEVPQELFGGLYTEATPESLPQGASPLCINCDFVVGAVLMRPGKQNVYYFSDFFVELFPNHAESDPGKFAPNEVPWTNPSQVTLGVPGVYASSEVNHVGGGSPFLPLDQVQIASDVNDVGGFTAGPITPVHLQEYGFLTLASGVITSTSFTPFAPFSDWFFGPFTGLTPLSCSVLFTAPTNYAAIYASLFTNGTAPAIFNANTISQGFSGGPGHVPVVMHWPNPTTAGKTILVTVANLGQVNWGPGAVIDNGGGTYTLLGSQQVIVSGERRSIELFGCSSSNGATTLTYQVSGSLVTSGASIEAAELSNFVGIPSFPDTQVLLTNNYPFSIPATEEIFGFQVFVTGHQTNADPSAVLNLSLNQPSPDSPTRTFQLPSSDGTVILGSPTDNWGLDLLNTTLNDPNFGVQLYGQANLGVDTGFFISGIEIKAFVTPNPAPNINYIKTFAETGGEIYTLALSSGGQIFQEDVVNNPGVLTVVHNNVEPDSFAQSATVDDREFIAISNLQNGTDIPLTYTPPNFDRLSQVGPGAPPSVTASSSAASINVVSITQAPATEIRRIAWGASSNAINNSTAGNILVIFGEGRTIPPGSIFTTLPNVMAPNTTVVLSGLPATFPLRGGGSLPYNLNGTYTILEVTTAIVGGKETCPCFTVQAPAVEYGHSEDFGSGGSPTSGWFYQSTLATLTASAQVPNLEVGGTLQLAGTGGSPPAGYDGQWTVLTSPNATTLIINSTGLNAATSTATYAYTVIGAGPNPAIGQLVTVTGTTNGNGIFNVANASITATAPGTFSIGLSGPADIPTTVESSASGLIFGTIFTFEPGQLVGTRNVGTVVIQGQITAGVRKVCYSFLTRNGFITQPSPILTVTIPNGAGSLVVSNLAIGPPNVIARIVHFTPTNGGNFYYIAEDVPVISNGQTITNTATIVNDNTSTTATFSFSDGVLLTGTQIDIEGNNLFECAEIGAPVMVVPFSQRVFIIGEQNKVTNFLNWSFDGGYGGNPGSRYPLGWTVDPTYGSGGNVIFSPIFGFAYQISNNTGSTQAVYGMITQPAYQDEFKVAIIEPSTTYSVRVTAQVNPPQASGTLFIELFSPTRGGSLGSFAVPLASATSSMQIYTGELLNTVLAPVPSDLLIRIWAANILNGATILIDRIEPFPTEAPNLNLQVTGSYNGNFESFDQVTGVILGTNVNQQPIVSAFVLFDQLYLVKTGSTVATGDNGTTEPDNWNIPRTISAAVGASGPYAVTTGIDEPNSGEEWAIVAGRTGGYIFAGGQFIKLTEEIQSVWNQINWKAGYAIWVKNDITNRRIMFGVPLNQLNAQGQSPSWLPPGLIEDPTNPTTPNVILELNYKQINTGNELAGSPEVHRSYSGKLIASEIVRKWSIWTIKTPCAAFITRPDNTAPLFLGNSDHTGKIYDLIEGLLEDDGVAIHQLYITSSFVSTETGQGMQMGSVRMNYDYMTMIVIGDGTLIITVYPNSLVTSYSHILLPNLTLPASTNGDVELPLNELGSRLFLLFECNAVGSDFQLSRIVMAMHQDPWSPVRGVNR